MHNLPHERLCLQKFPTFTLELLGARWPPDARPNAISHIFSPQYKHMLSSEGA